MANKIVPVNEQVSIEKGTSKQLFYTVLPDSAARPKVTFKSSDTEVVTVSEDGTIVGKTEGKAKITLTAEDGSTCEWSITVKNKSAAGILG